MSVITKDQNVVDQPDAVVREQARQAWVREIVDSQQQKKGLAAVIGHWPGEESEKEFNESLDDFFERRN